MHVCVCVMCSVCAWCVVCMYGEPAGAGFPGVYVCVCGVKGRGRGRDVGCGTCDAFGVFGFLWLAGTLQLPGAVHSLLNCSWVAITWVSCTKMCIVFLPLKLSIFYGVGKAL